METVQAHHPGNSAGHDQLGVVGCGQMAPAVERKQRLHARPLDAVEGPVADGRGGAGIERPGQALDLVVMRGTGDGTDRGERSTLLFAERAADGCGAVRAAPRSAPCASAGNRARA